MGPFRSEHEAWMFAALLFLIAFVWLLILSGCQVPLR